MTHQGIYLFLFFQKNGYKIWKVQTLKIIYTFKIDNYISFPFSLKLNLINKMSTVIDPNYLKGGEFLLKESKASNIFTPEDFTEDQIMVINMVKDFIQSRIAPNYDTLEKLDIPLTCQLMKEMGELGILGISFPEEFGGSDMGIVSSIVLSELMAEGKSMSITFSAHTGIGMLPLLYYGTEAQKQQYLPGLVSGDILAAYCLTEPGSGSDALAAKSSAVLSKDGQHYILNGQKMWITNGGFADLFTVFAKIDGQHFTAFLVEKDWDGVSLGEEEDKLGIKGSSTRQVFFENVKVPVENLLGEIGKGHKIAFNILNIGRIKLAAGAFGGSKHICTYSIDYANQRSQFGKSISSFGAIQHKLAEQAIKIWINEAATYRAAHYIHLEEEALQAEGKSSGEALLGGAEEYAIECALMKVHGSECLDYCADEGVQIYGGMGYSEEAPMAAVFRDSRINRIFEGTNEINRMLSMSMLLKRALKGELDLMSAVMDVQKEMTNPPATTASNGKVLSREKMMVSNLKKAFLLISGATVQKFMQNIESEQEVLMHLSDMMGDIFLAESGLLRVEKMIENRGEEASKIFLDISQVFLDDAVDRFIHHAKRVVTAWAEGDERQVLLAALKRFTKYDGINTVAARRRIAAKLIEANKYCF